MTSNGQLCELTHSHSKSFAFHEPRAEVRFSIESRLRSLPLFLRPRSDALERVVMGVAGVFEVADDGAPRLAALVNLALGDGADAAGRGGGEVDDVLGIEAHQPRGGGVHGGRVVA